MKFDDIVEIAQTIHRALRRNDVSGPARVVIALPTVTEKCSIQEEFMRSLASSPASMGTFPIFMPECPYREPMKFSVMGVRFEIATDEERPADSKRDRYYGRPGAGGM